MGKSVINEDNEHIRRIREKGRGERWRRRGDE